MRPTHLPELTILFTCRIDSYSRFKNTIAAIRYYEKYTDAQIFLLEADRVPNLFKTLKSEFPNIEYQFIEDDNPIFHRTHYLNMQMSQVKTHNTANIDVDTIVPMPQLAKANNILLTEHAVMVLPYDGRFVCHYAARSDLFRREVDIRIFENITVR